MKKRRVNRIILDTNIYGNLSKERNPYTLTEKLRNNKDFVFYGIREIIRKEVRNTPKNIRLNGKSLRILLINLYDVVVRGHNLSLDDNIKFIADRYYDTYRIFGGNLSRKDIILDFYIVACAASNDLDIVVSDDLHSMFSDSAIKSFEIINKTLKLRNPNFINYNKFKRLFSL